MICQNASPKAAGCQQVGMQGRALASAALLMVWCLSSQHRSSTVADSLQVACT